MKQQPPSIRFGILPFEIDTNGIDPMNLLVSVRYRTNTGREVQSCLIGWLDRENTPAPDAYVLCGDWIEDNWPDPISGEWHDRSPDETNNTPWEELFWTEMENFSPNTRVTAVNCHY